MNWDEVLTPMLWFTPGSAEVHALNGEARQLLGASQGALALMLGAGGARRWERLARRVLRADVPLWFEDELELELESAGRDWVSVRLAMCSDAEARGVTITLSDLSEERARRSRDARALDFLRRMLGLTPNLFFVVDRFDHLVFHNAAFERLCGTVPTLVRAASLPQADERLFERLAEVFEGSGEQSVELAWARVGGPAKTFQWLLQPIDDSSGRVRQVLVVASDLSELVAAHGEQRRLQSELDHAKRLESIGQMAGTIAHDFNGFLTVLLGSLDLLSARLGGGEYDTMLDDMLMVCEQARELTRDLTQLSRTQVQGRTRGDPGQLSKSLAFCLPRLVPKTVELCFDSTFIDTVDPALRLPLSEANCMQIVMNLVNNAAEAMKGSGAVEVTLTTERDEAGRELLVMLVVDDGPGIAPGISERMFEPFFTTRGDEGGTGLGLASARGLIERAGGTITVSSEPGAGASFRVALPLAVADEYLA